MRPMLFLATYAAFDWQPTLPVAAIVGLTLILAGTLCWAWRGLVARFGIRRAWPILAARGLLFFLLVLALLDPVFQTHTTHQEERQVLLLNDVSGSMQICDGKEPRRVRAQHLVEQIQHLLPEGMRLHEKRFDAAMHPANYMLATNSVEPLGTDVAAALSDAAEHDETPDTAAIVLITDGGDEAIQPARFPVAPLIILGVGSPGGDWPVLGIGHVESPEVVEKGSKFTLSAELYATGPVTFRGKLNSIGVSLNLLQGEKWLPVDHRVVDLRAGRSRVDFTTTSGDAGIAQYRVVVDPVQGALTTLTNRKTIHVDVRNKTLDILYFSRRLGADLKMLRQVMGTDPGITFTALYRSSGSHYTVQTPSTGPAIISEAELTRGFPVDLNRLRRFDCLILGSFPAHEWSAEEMKTLLQFAEDGGGIILLGGDDSFDGGGYGVTPLQPLLPWKCSGSTSSLLREDCIISIPSAAEQSPAVAGLQEILASVGEKGKNKPGGLIVTSINDPGAPLPGAEVLMEASTSRSGHKTPLVLEHRYGKGHILTVASNTTWLWGREPGPTALFYQQFWRQAVRAVCGHVEGGRLLQVSWNKTVFHSGDRVVATIRIPGMTDARLRALVAGPGGSRFIAVESGQDSGVWRAEWLVDSRGVWTAQFTVERNGETLDVFRKNLPVAPLPDEGSHLFRQDAELDRLASRAHGTYFREEQLDCLPGVLETYLRPVSHPESRALTSAGPWFALLLLLIILTELLLRRRLNLI